MRSQVKPRLDVLTSLRFFAALFVVVFHAARPFLGEVLASVPREARNIVLTGYVSVGFFFILSGFVLAYTYGSRDLLKIKKRKFWWARFARIYPVFLLGTLLGAVPALMELQRIHGSNEAAVKFLFLGLLNVLMLGAWYPDASIFNYPSWSLSAEAFFYLLFPVVAALLWRLSGTRLLIACALIGLLAMVPAAVAVLMDAELLAWKAVTGAPSTLSTQSSAWAEFVKSGALTRLPDFILGIGLGKLFLERMSARGQPSQARLDHGTRALLATAVIVAILSQADQIPYLLLHSGLLNLLFAYVIYEFAMDTGWVSRALNLPALLLLGEASYALYILHVPIRDWFLAGSKRTGLDGFTSQAGRFLLYVTFVTGISIAVFKLLEDPLRRRLRNIDSGSASKPRASDD